MKKTLRNFVLAMLFIGATTMTYAQIEITPQYGYQIGSKYNFYNGYIKLTDSAQYGITLDVDVNDQGTQVELFWVYQDSEVRVLDYFLYPFETTLTDVTANHFQFGVIQNFQDGDFRPFAGMSGGFTVFDPADSFYSSRTKFTLGFSGGIKYFFTERIGIRLQSQLLMPIEWGGVYISSGGGGITTGGSLLQLNFSGGLIFALGE